MTLAIRWVGSPNYSPGRDGHNPNWTADDPSTWIVLHTMVGWRAGTVSAFSSAARQASSTYGVNLDGSYDQYVKEEDAPWTNGTYANNPGSNLDSITIECEDGGDYMGPRTPALYEAAAQLVADISKRRGIPLIHRGAGGGVLAHSECNGAQTACYDALDGDRIIARAIEILNPPVVVTPSAPPLNTAQPPTPLVPSDQPSPASFDLVKAIPLVVMATDADSGKTVGPGPLTTAFVRLGGVGYALTQYSHDHNEGLGMRLSDIQSAVAIPPPPLPVPLPVPTPTPAPPAPIPDPVPAAPTALAPPDPNILKQIIAWLRWLLSILSGGK